MSLEAKAAEFAKRFPHPTGYPTWSQKCGMLMFRFGASLGGKWETHGDISTAFDASLQSGYMHKGSFRAPVGAFHWWADRAGNRPGHVALDMRGSGKRLFMASAGPLIKTLGPAIGIQSVHGYSAAHPAMKYLGWTTNYAGARIPSGLLATASVGPVTPVVVPVVPAPVPIPTTPEPVPVPVPAPNPVTIPDPVVTPDPTPPKKLTPAISYTILGILGATILGILYFTLGIR